MHSALRQESLGCGKNLMRLLCRRTNNARGKPRNIALIRTRIERRHIEEMHLGRRHCCNPARQTNGTQGLL